MSVYRTSGPLVNGCCLDDQGAWGLSGRAMDSGVRELDPIPF